MRVERRRPTRHAFARALCSKRPLLEAPVALGSPALSHQPDEAKALDACAACTGSNDTNQAGSVCGGVCIYPDCNCPFDAPADPNWCAKGLPQPRAVDLMLGPVPKRDRPANQGQIMPTYHMSCTVTVSAYTTIEADSLEAAIEAASYRPVERGLTYEVRRL